MVEFQSEAGFFSLGFWLLFSFISLSFMAAKKGKALVFSLILILVLVWLIAFQELSRPEDQLRLVFCDVGQGDAALVIYGQWQALIDGGPNRKVLECLADYLPFYDRTLEMVVVTHPQKDHFGGLIDVVERYRVEQFVFNNLGGKGLAWDYFQELVEKEGALVYSPKAGEKIKVGDLEFEVLWPSQERLALVTGEGRVLGAGDWGTEVETNELSLDPNELSVVLALSFGEFEALLTGDIDFDIEKEIEEKWDSRLGGSIEVLKVAHHGSKYASSEIFLKKLKPELAVVSTGKNSFGHPTKEALERLRMAGAQVLRTDEAGSVEIVTDGREWSF